MIRTQISLTDEQMERLRRLAKRRGVSIAAVVRDAVDRCFEGDERATRLERLLGAAGAFSSRTTNTSEDHDAVLEEAHRDR